MSPTPIQDDPALAEVLASGDAGDWIGVMGHLQDEARLPSAAQVITRFGNIVTLKLRRGDLPVLQDSGACDIIEASRRLTVPNDNDRVAPADTIDSQPMRPAGLTETGAGVVVGVVDWGIDFAHPAFLKDGKTRLLAIWDQRGPVTDSGDSAQPNRWGYGRILTREQINAALAEPDPYEALDYRPWDADRAGDGAHGTHVASIAAGSAYAGSQSGVASNADLVFVHLANTPNILAGQSLGSAQSALEAMDFIFEVAGERPAVINLSVGAHGGSHTGRSLVERGMDQAVWMRPGRAIVNSAGNYRQKGAHASGRLKQDEARTLSFVLPPHDRNNSEVEVFYAPEDRIAVMLTAPDGTAFGPLDIDSTTPLMIDDQKIGQLYQRLDPASADRHVDLFLYTDAPPGQWQLTLHGQQIQDGRFHAWIERDASQQPFFIGDDVDTRTTIGTLANGEFSITTGAYDRRNPERSIGSFSSLGPTRTGRIKPEVIAPGVRILAARSTPRGSRAGDRTTVKTGTSMAAPMVAGAVALMFEAAEKPLNISDTRALLFSSLDTSHACSHRACYQEDLHGRGYGALNIKKLLQQTHQWRRNTQESAVTDSDQSLPDQVGHGLTGGVMHDVHDTDDDLSQYVVKTPYQAQSGDLLVTKSFSEGICRTSILVDDAGIDPDQARAKGLFVEQAGPGLYAEVLEDNGSGQHFNRVVRKIANRDGQSPRGRRLYGQTNDRQPLVDEMHSTPFAETSTANLSAWQDLISFRPSPSIQSMLRHRFRPDAYVHRLEAARGDLSADYYPVRVTHMPIIGGRRISAAELLRIVRLDINRFID
ncbi:MAG: S8 family serine peptidase, partial [Pseudomonadota bacterium]